MGNFNFIKIDFPGLHIIEPKVFGDDRGFFLEAYNYSEFFDSGLEATFIQDNHSRSHKGVLRGMHYQKQYPQGKLVRVINGAVFDAVIDLRKGSPTFGKWFGVELSAKNKKMLFIPRGFAQGFLILEDNTDLMYKCTDQYHPEDEGGLMWNDQAIGIQWPLENVDKDLILSEKDKKWPKFEQLDFFFDFERYKI